MLGSKKKLEIANVCYANVSGLFAMFINPKYRGPNFTWKYFIEHCEENADLWLMIANIKGKKDEINVQAKIYAKEIAERLVKRAGLDEESFPDIESVIDNRREIISNKLDDLVELVRKS